MIPLGRYERNAFLYCRGLQPPGYLPNLLDITAACLRVFEDPPFIIRQIKL